VRRLGGGLVVALLLAACGTTAQPSPSGDLATDATASTEPAATAPSPGATVTPPTPTVSFSHISPDGIAATVTRVVDGDTIHATVHGKDEKIRIIGLDSPETSKPGTPIECFAREATRAAERLLPVGSRIRVQMDPSQDTRDRYGRLLAHVVLSDGRLFAEIMIRHGDAIHYIYDGVPSMYADRFAAAEAHAKATGAGLWSTSTCRGNDHAPSAAP